MSPLNPLLQTIGWALLHFLWQGCLIWLATVLALGLALGLGPQSRYLLACAGLALCLVLPVATFLYLQPTVFRQVGEAALAATLPVSREPLAGVAVVLAVPRSLGLSIEDYVPLLFQAWLVGSLLMALRFTGSWLYLMRVQMAGAEANEELQARCKRIASQCGMTRPIRFALSTRITTPMVVGWLRPLLLVPVGLLTCMNPAGLEALLVHELAHIRRHDYFVNVVQCVVEILLFYHPAVWWISRRVRTERELCCDDAAVSWCKDPLLYAETLTRLHELRSETLAPALAAGGGDLMFRIKRLLVPTLRSSNPSMRLNLGALACSLLLLLSAGMSLKAMQSRPADEAKWFLAGSNRKDYVQAMDSQTLREGKPSLSLSSTIPTPAGFGTAMQNVAPTDYLGKRVRLSAWVKTAKVPDWAGLWMRVDGPEKAMLAFDNMGKRPIKGTTDWTRHDLVLDVAPTARNLAFGLLLSGPGQAWLNDLRLEVVDSTVAVTDTAGDSGPSMPAGLSAEAWFMAGSHPADYQTNLDPAVLRDGKPTHLLASKGEKPQGFGTLMQMFKGQAYLGKRVRLSAWVKSDSVADWAGVWMRVDAANGKPTAFDNMQKRAIKGTSDWTRCDVVMDVSPDSAGIALGILLSGQGKVWMTEPLLEIVGPEVPVTAMK